MKMQRFYYRYIPILILLSILTLATNQRACADEKKEHHKLSLQQFSSKITREIEYVNKGSGMDKLMAILKIKPGITILDIGTGTGQYAYKFAERLKGTGKVFATDSNIDCINYVTEEAHKRGLRNLYPVLVSRDGIDKFYGQHKYDLITIFHVAILSESPENRVDYFKKLRGFLTENGRLVTIFFKDFSLFCLDDFSNFKGLIKELSLEDRSSPFYKGLRKTTQELIKENAGHEPTELLKKAIVDDFNDMLLDHHFCTNFLKDGQIFLRKVSFSPEEINYVNWLWSFLIKHLVILDKAQKDLQPIAVEGIKGLNKLFIIQQFRQYFHKSGTFPFSYKKMEVILTVFKMAGYKLESRYNFMPFNFILVFTADKDA